MLRYNPTDGKFIIDTIFEEDTILCGIDFELLFDEDGNLLTGI